MRIIEDYNVDDANDVIEITNAVYIDEHALKITFSDRSEKTVSFKEFLSKAQHPSISKYLDENLFKTFQIKDGNLNWNDYDLIFPVYDLYIGNI